MLLIFIFLPFFSVFAQKIPDRLRIPKELEELGFTRSFLVEYKKIADKEFFTFDNWRTAQGLDTITFVIENGKVKDVFKGKRIKLKERGT
ncbi:MAG: hypothetical protein WCI77_03845 [Candidatus Omnitrophota bacterium]